MIRRTIRRSEVLPFRQMQLGLAGQLDLCVAAPFFFLVTCNLANQVLFPRKPGRIFVRQFLLHNRHLHTALFTEQIETLDQNVKQNSCGRLGRFPD